jgi:hypothetical protein
MKRLRQGRPHGKTCPVKGKTLVAPIAIAVFLWAGLANGPLASIIKPFFHIKV